MLQFDKHDCDMIDKKIKTMDELLLCSRILNFFILLNYIKMCYVLALYFFNLLI